MPKREFEFQDGSSHKFWSIELSGTEHTARYGRVGTTGQSTTKSFADKDKAKASYEKLIEQKVGKGYLEKSSGTTKKVAKKKAASAKKKAVKKTSAKKVQKKSVKKTETPPATIPSQLKNARQFVFDDGKSQKFWAIALDGTKHTVNYGRMGTDGQTKQKSFGDKSKAKADANKLVAAKIGKGYVELDELGQPVAPKPTPPKKRAKAVDAKQAMKLIRAGKGEGVVCKEPLCFLGEPYKNQDWRFRRNPKRKQAKPVDLPNFLIAPAVELTESKWVKEIPIGWEVGDLQAGRCFDLTKIGEGLKCYTADFSATQINELPDDISIDYHLDLTGCDKLESLPDNLTVTKLTLESCTALTALPEGLNVAYLNISDCTALTSFPKKGAISVGAVEASGCRNLTNLPSWLKTISHLDVEGCTNLKSLPSGLQITSWLDMAGSGLTKLPPSSKKAPIRWRGVPVDYRTAFEPHKLKGKDVLAQENVEVRRVMMERMGYDRFVNEVDAEVLDEDKDPGGRRQLLKVPLADEDDLVCVSVKCPSTARQYIIRVPPNMTSCHQAIAWTAGFDDAKKYKPKKET